MKRFRDEVLTYQPQMDDVESTNQSLQAALVFDNPHTSYSMEV